MDVQLTDFFSNKFRLQILSFISILFSNAKPLSLSGMTDWHCHILPGVDDGVQDIEESLEILRSYELAGIKNVWLTPHIMEDIPNKTEYLKKRFDELNEAYDGGVKLHLAAENMIDNLFLERLEANDILTIGGTNTVLVETSYYNPPIQFFDKIEQIKSKGYFPLLAHPERYNYIDNIATYRRLKDMGVRFQLNLLSLYGYYGPIIKEKALKLLSEGMIECCGTDLHRREHFGIINNKKLSENVLQQVQHLVTNVNI